MVIQISLSDTPYPFSNLPPFPDSLFYIYYLEGLANIITPAFQDCVVKIRFDGKR